VAASWLARLAAFMSSGEIGDKKAFPFPPIISAFRAYAPKQKLSRSFNDQEYVFTVLAPCHLRNRGLKICCVILALVPKQSYSKLL